MQMFSKYIILKDRDVPIIFPHYPLSHEEIALNKGVVKSAGYCKFSINETKISVTCFGSSSSLGITANPIEDKRIIEEVIFKIY